MWSNSILAWSLASLTAALLLVAPPSGPRPVHAQALTPAEAQQIAEDAYIYGYSLITTEVTLYFQNESPGKDKEANWLPAPKAEFITMMRMYWPKEKAPSILNGTWKIPTVVKVQ
jgi:hypothetical protein